MSNEFFAEVRRQMHLLSYYIDHVARVARMFLAFFLALVILSMRWLLTIAEHAEPYVRTASRAARSGLIRARRNTMSAARMIKEREKDLEPKVIDAVKKLEEVVVETAVKVAPPAKKAAWGVWRLAFAAWVAGTVAIIGIVALSG